MSTQSLQPQPVITNPASKKRIKDAMEQISLAMSRIESERNYIKETIENIHDEFAISKRTFRRMVKVYHSQAYVNECEAHDEFTLLYETITSAPATQNS